MDRPPVSRRDSAAQHNSATMGERRDVGLSRVSAPLPPLTRFSGRPELDRSSAHSDGLQRSSIGAFLAGKASPLDRKSGSLERASVELASRGALNAVTLTLAVESCVDGDAVHFKPDGNRFETCDSTIKLAAGVSYRLVLVTSPALELLNGVVLVTVHPPGGDLHQDVVSVRPCEEDRKGVEGTWKCVLAPCGKGLRAPMFLSGKIRDFGEVEVPLMAKVYGWKDSHRRQGSVLRSVVFDLRRRGDTPDIGVKAARYMA